MYIYTFVYLYICVLLLHPFVLTLKKVSVGTLVRTDAVIGLHVQTLIMETIRLFIYIPFSFWELQTIARMVLYTA